MGKGKTPSKGNAIVGTPAYMPPEQARRGDRRPRRPVRAGLRAVPARQPASPPSPGRTCSAILVSIASDQPSPPRSVPRDLVRLIMQLLAKQPAQRPASAEAVALAFDGHAAETGERLAPPLDDRLPLGVAGPAGGLVWRLTLLPPGKPPAPGRVTFVLDEANRQIILTPDEGEERTIDLARESEVELPPGGYGLRHGGKKRNGSSCPAG